MGSNPLRSGPNLHKVRDVFEALEFVVVQDLFMSETAQMADVVLPAASFAEKEGTFTSASRLVQTVRKIIDPIGQSRSDWEILCDLSGRMGYAMKYRRPEDIMEEIASLVPAYGGISYARLEAGGLRAPCPTQEHPGTEFLWGKTFKTKTGRGKFFPAHYQLSAETQDAEYPFILTTVKDLYHLHTGSYTRQSAVLFALCPEDLLEISRADAQKLGLDEGERVRVRSRRGQIALALRISDRVPEGTVSATFHSSEVNVLTTDSLDKLAKVPELKLSAVRIEKIPCC